MVEVKMQLPEQLARRILPVRQWMPTVLGLSLVKLETPAREVAVEIIDFLLANPSPDDVMSYHASERAQARLQRLLALGEAGLLGEAEQRELDELQQIEHAVIMLKAQLAGEWEEGK
ncbi:MAG: hypothetical protein MAG451_02017 [Anaerolineales bacterium]|nr:hypothetical protein [Anaerolineales bacterium]